MIRLPLTKEEIWGEAFENALPASDYAWRMPWIRKCWLKHLVRFADLLAQHERGQCTDTEITQFLQHIASGPRTVPERMKTAIRAALRANPTVIRDVASILDSLDGTQASEREVRKALVHKAIDLGLKYACGAPPPLHPHTPRAA
jgi:hypothetical protein